MYFVLSVQVVVVDDLSNAVEESLNRVRELTKCDDDQLVFRKVRSPPPGGAAVFPLDLTCPVSSCHQASPTRPALNMPYQPQNRVCAI